MRNISKLHASIGFGLLLAVCSAAAEQEQSDLITFEPEEGYLPNGSLASDNLVITTQYQEQYGVSFGFDADGDLNIDPGSSLRLENTANSNGDWAYWSSDGATKYNTAAPGYEDQLGDWFLTNDRTQAGSNSILIEYDNSVTAASGEIWDIDGRSNGNGEQWLVSAYDENGNLIGSAESPLGIRPGAQGNLDSRPWLWSFSVTDGSEISAISMQSVGDVTNGPVAFNNFATSSPTNNLISSPTPVTVARPHVGAPEPEFWGMLSTFGLISFLSYRKKRKARKS